MDTGVQSFALTCKDVIQKFGSLHQTLRLPDIDVPIERIRLDGNTHVKYQPRSLSILTDDDLNLNDPPPARPPDAEPPGSSRPSGPTSPEAPEVPAPP